MCQSPKIINMVDYAQIINTTIGTKVFDFLKFIFNINNDDIIEKITKLTGIEKNFTFICILISKTPIPTDSKKSFFVGTTQ